MTIVSRLRDFAATSRCAAAIVIVAVIQAMCAPAQAVTVRDASGRAVEVKDTSRIVSVGGAITEILYALSVSDRIAGVDTTSLFPADALKDKPNVGYMRALSAEGVLSLNPSVVIAIEGAGPKEAIAVLESAGVPLVRVPDRFTDEGIVEKVRLVANVAGVPARGECLAHEIANDLAALSRIRNKIGKKKRVLFVMSLLNGKPIVAGRNSAADAIIRLAGGENAVDTFDGYKQISDEAVVAANPDTVLAMERSRDRVEEKAIFAQTAFAMTKAASDKSFIAMDGLSLLGFGPRTAKAARDIATELYPSLGREALPSERKPGC